MVMLEAFARTVVIRLALLLPVAALPAFLVPDRPAEARWTAMLVVAVLIILITAADWRSRRLRRVVLKEGD